MAHSRSTAPKNRTTAAPEPPRYPGKLQEFAASVLAEFLPRRPYPLEMSTWTPVPFNTVAALLSPFGLALPPFESLFLQEDGIIIRYRGRVPFRITPRMMLAPFIFIGLARRYGPVRWRDDPLLAEAISCSAALAARDVRGLDWQGLLSAVHDSTAILAPFLGELRHRYMPGAVLAIACLRIEMALLCQGKRFSALLSGVETKTLETNLALEGFASEVRGDPVLAGVFAEHEARELRAVLEGNPRGRSLLSRLDAFLDCYGHRETESLFLIREPTWQEAPEVVLGIIKQLVRSELAARSVPPAWEKARDDVLRHPLLRLPPLRRRFLKLLEDARCLTAIREDTRFYGAMPLPVMRQAFLEMGRRLAATGALDGPPDVFHLTMGELEALRGTWPPSRETATELRAAALSRKEKRAAWESTPLFDPRLFRRAVIKGSLLISGTPASQGVAEGPVRVILDPSEFAHLRPGEVLVAPHTTPAWTPLFRQAAAVVVDRGGTTSHAAIVAREYGIPAVMGTGDGTRRLRDGQNVRVDGTQGKVFAAGRS